MASTRKKSTNLIEVAVALPVHGIFTYRTPERLKPFAEPGKRVLAPFGARKTTGYILRFTDVEPVRPIKPIVDILDETPLFPPNMIPFFEWMSRYYKHPIGDTIKTALPGGLNLDEYKTVAITEQGLAALEHNPASGTETDILRFLSRRAEGVRFGKLRGTSGGKSPGVLVRKMEEKGWVTVRKELSGGKTKHRMAKFLVPTVPDSAKERKKLGPVKEKLLKAVEETGEISMADLRAINPHASTHVKDLESEGLLSSVMKKEYRDPLGAPISRDRPPELNREQKEAVCRVLEKIDDGFRVFLLAGVTGSGKTEVYLHLAADVIGRGKNVLILVPEIALITQMVRRFRARFGDSLAVLHSGLSDGERFDQWARINSGEVAIAIGARSAIFAPFENPGLIVVDEEHDGSYKQENRFRYNARDLAVVRARQNGCVALLGSATPSVQSFHNVMIDKFERIELKRRIENRPLAEISVVDLRDRPDARGRNRFFSPELVKAMKETLENKEQVLLFLNRRGFAYYPVCATCGDAFRCRHCEITLTLHKSDNAFKCHFCGYSTSSNSLCPTCGSPNIMHLGLGTEKIEEAVKSMFPDARTARMDRDSTRRKGALVKILRDLKKRDIDVLVGTQMVTKGHDFPNITMVGIVCADLSLSFPDFRAGEQTFQLLAQAAGRAGRGQIPGKVILQTYNPNHFSIMAARDQDFKRFYDHEIVFRKALSYPPFSRLVQLSISGKDKEKTRKFSLGLGSFLKRLQNSSPSFGKHIEIMGPIEAPLSKIADNYRWQVLIKGLDAGALHGFVNMLVYRDGPWLNNREVKVAVDIDPFLML